jgi:hypothetical protein
MAARSVPASVDATLLPQAVAPASVAPAANIAARPSRAFGAGEGTEEVAGVSAPQKGQLGLSAKTCREHEGQGTSWLMGALRPDINTTEAGLHPATVTMR